MRQGPWCQGELRPREARLTPDGVSERRAVRRSDLTDEQETDVCIVHMPFRDGMKPSQKKRWCAHMPEEQDPVKELQNPYCGWSEGQGKDEAGGWEEPNSHRRFWICPEGTGEPLKGTE